MKADHIAVVGAGTMGSGIAQVAVEAGFRVSLIDTKDELVERGIAVIRTFLERKVSKNKITQDECDKCLSRLRGTIEMRSGVEDAAMVVEAVFEDLNLKREIFCRLDGWCPPEVILASNTSTLSITKLACATRHPERVIGTHYFSPVPLMRLVEVVRGEKTSEAVAERTLSLCRSFGKTAIMIKDVPGFIVNRFLCLLYNEAANLINGGVASAGDIDAALKLGCNWPMGVAEIMDMAGVDVVLLALTAMYEMTGEERYKPSPLFQTMVENNQLGRKTGKGFYEQRQ